MRSRVKSIEEDLRVAREEASGKQVEIVRLEGDVRKASEDLQAVLSASGSDRERVLGDQLSASTSKAHELEKALGVAGEEAKSLKRRLDEALSAGDNEEASRVGAEKEVQSLREEVMLLRAENERVEGVMKKQGEDLQAIVSSSGSEREALILFFFIFLFMQTLLSNVLPPPPRFDKSLTPTSLPPAFISLY